MNNIYSPHQNLSTSRLRTFAAFSVLLALLCCAREGTGGENALLQNSDAHRIDQSATVPRDFLFDGDVKEWQGTTPTFALSKYQSLGREGNIWIGQTEQGLIISGKIRGDKPRWPKAPDKMAVSDHVEVWLSDANELELPPIGWGNQFGNELLTAETDCNRFQSEDTRKSNKDAVKECTSWYKAQLKYRKSFNKLFVRQWQIAPGLAVETYSSPAFLSFDQAIQKKLRLLKPSGSPDVKIREATGKDHAYSFEIVIPWNAFPPLKPLQLKNIRIMVDIFSPGPGKRKYGAFSSTSPNRKYGVVQTFNTLTLKPRDYYLTPCKYDLPNSDPIISLDPSVRYLSASEAAQLYFLPAEDLDLRTLLLLDNEVQGYQYNVDPKSNSPIVHPVNFFTLQIAPQELICGPRLAYVQNGTVYKWENFVFDSQKFFEARKLSDGSILIKEGPRVFFSYYGSGQCGACPRVLLNIIHIDTRNKIASKAYVYEGMTQTQISDIDIHVPDDWKTVTIFEEHVDRGNGGENRPWSKSDYCLDLTAGEYNACGNQDLSLPPAPRVLEPEK